MNEIINNNDLEDLDKFCNKKNAFFKDLIQKTLQNIQYYKILKILNAHEVNLALKQLEASYILCEKIDQIMRNKYDRKDIVEQLQTINDNLSFILKNYGTKNIEDILYIVFGKGYLNSLQRNNKYDIISRFLQPISYKVLDWKHDKHEKKPLKKNRIVEDFIIVESAETLDCFDLARSSQNFITKVYGIKVVFQDKTNRKTLIVSAILENSLLSCFNNEYIGRKLIDLKENAPNEEYFTLKDFHYFVDSLSLKELLVYNNNELYSKYVGYQNQIRLIKQKPISQVVKEFINSELYSQRNTLIQLLIKYENAEFQYLAYLLYDLLSNDEKGNIDTTEQSTIYDSLPWNLKKMFKHAMKTTIEYTRTLANADSNAIPLEQQICLMKVSDSVKEKAMLKLKEVKAKSEDSGSKARQYLDGLLKIPFGIYREEPCLQLIKTINSHFTTAIMNNEIVYTIHELEKKPHYTMIEIQNKIKETHNNISIWKQTIKNNFINDLRKRKRKELKTIVTSINTFIKEYKILHNRIKCTGKKNKELVEEVSMFIHCYDKPNLYQLIEENKYNQVLTLEKNLHKIHVEWLTIHETMKYVRNVLDEAVYGHDTAKRQIERVIGQWMSGKQTGYCFGFEGPPGIGKTSLAKKGLAKCLLDENNVSRPFGFIAIGGSSNGSTLDGHNYTYVGSTWGRIVDILIESKCMNPIIFIDELDKVSKTEHGKEIIGILTHLVDPTQNDSFHDKYFNGIDIDLSKALFIFSYNDVELLDRILLDRIHRITFKSLSIEEKVVITKKHILPEIYEKVNLKDVITIRDEIIEYIIDNYTRESGVRKLKEILFEIMGEINLEVLQTTYNDTFTSIPFDITKDMIKNKYLKDRHEIQIKKIHTCNEVGIINGLWANAIGQGGIIPIQTTYYPTATFLDLKLTGMQGDVMKESMNVAKTLAYKLTSDSRKKHLIKYYKETNMQGIHIHCPEGAVPKDGPSAGTAITCSIYSLLNDIPIPNNIAITGEINLQGNVTAIGGLELKILGGIKAGIKHFIYPKDNSKDYETFMEKYKTNDVLNKITFTQVVSIKEVLTILFDEKVK